MTLAKRLQKLEASVVVERQKKRQAPQADELRRKLRGMLEILTRVQARVCRKEGREVLRLLRYRHKLVQMRARVKKKSASSG